MKTTALLATLAAMLLPDLALAMCSGHDKTAQISCADGTIYDPETESCVETTS